MEPNGTMLEIAKKKNSNIAYKQGYAEDLPYKDNVFDVILCTQVLHHLLNPEKKSKKYERVKKAISEMSKIIKKNGITIINNSSIHQCCNSFWYYSLIPETKRKVKNYLISNEKIMELLLQNNFKSFNAWNDVFSILINEYFKEDGPLHKSWRNGDSVWSLVSTEELNKAIYTVKTLIKDNKMKDYIKKHDKKRLKFGQTTFIIAKKYN